jgi:hypothetical protein
MDTPNGSYNLWFGNTLVDNGTAEGYYVSSNFTIPQVAEGSYTVTLTDVAVNENATTSLPVLTAYSAKPILPTGPAQLQEGNSVVLNVTITAGQPNTQYGADIIVMLPAPLNTNYTKSLSFTTSSLGTAITQVTFPDASFSPSGSSTTQPGEYSVTFNSTMLSTDSFTIGFTDLTEYDRQDTVKINAVGYQPGESASLSIRFNNTVVHSEALTASDQGAISTTWAIPSTAAIGTYTANITSSSKANEAQTFEVVGYPVIFTALNLAGEPVPNLSIEAYDQQSSQTFNATTDDTGMALLTLGEGDQTITAYWNQVNVAQTQTSVAKNSQTAQRLTINCQLTDLTIKVVNTNGVAIPSTDIAVTYQYVDRTGATQTGSLSNQTNTAGTFTLNSTLPQITYTVTASKYNNVFNAGNNTISNIPAQPSTQAVIVCPDETLTLTTVDYNNAVLPNARVTLIEQSSGLFYSVNTDSNGAAQLQVTFGQYRVSVYTSDNVLLNETVVNVFDSTNTQLRTQYNFALTVKVVDYFGNPVSNANVQISKAGATSQSAVTKGDGTAVFNNIAGGSINIVAYPAGNPDAFVATNLQVNSPTTVKLVFDKYIALGGTLISTSMLVAILLIILAVVLLVVVEVFRRFGFKLRSRNES